MPKILINEIDDTSAGTPGRYSNYAVLIAGYKGEPAKDEKKWQAADENGVYEFSSAQAFKDTIGESATTLENGECHYGNRMAYELLNLGYTVIYRVIESVRDMDDEDFWAIFKDKASYDFRFISNGLLKSQTQATYYTDCDKRDAMLADLQLLKEIEIEAGIEENQKEFKLKDIIACDTLFAAKLSEAEANDESYGSFSDTTVYNTAYTTYHVAAGFTIPDGIDLNGTLTAKELEEVGTKSNTAGIAGELAVVNGTIETADKSAITAGVFNRINGHIAKLACYRDSNEDGAAECDGRGDCLALIELDESVYVGKDKPVNEIINGIKGMSSQIGDEGAYCALTVPSVHYYVDGVTTKEMPGAFHYLACFMRALGAGYAEWYAVAGYNRGVSNYVIDHTSVKLGELAINALEPRNIVDDPNKAQPPFACNVIANFRGSYYLWGNRTAAPLGAAAGGADLTAKHFLNIRQLCTTIKKQLYVSCRRFTFDPNSDTLWFNFVNSITPTLDAMKADQGIRDYSIVKVATDKKATLKARVRIIPIEAVEDFDLTVSLEDSFGAVSVNTAG